MGSSAVISAQSLDLAAASPIGATAICMAHVPQLAVPQLGSASPLDRADRAVRSVVAHFSHPLAAIFRQSCDAGSQPYLQLEGGRPGAFGVLGGRRSAVRATAGSPATIWS